jgi:hypothetical protein
MEESAAFEDQRGEHLVRSLGQTRHARDRIRSLFE